MKEMLDAFYDESAMSQASACQWHNEFTTALTKQSTMAQP